MTTPIIGADELVQGQAIPEVTVNGIVRLLEQGALWFGNVNDRDLTAPPGSPADGDCYIVGASATGAWAGEDNNIAIYVSTAWEFIAVSEGMAAYLADENKAVVFDGSAWGDLGGGGGSSAREWDFNFTAAGEAVIRSRIARTISQAATTGTGTVAYAKSTAASPDTFASATAPVTLEAGAKLKVSVTGVSGTFAVHLESD